MTVLRQFGLGLKLAGRTLVVELFGKPLKNTTPPADGQVLRYVDADGAWSPGTVAGGGSLGTLSDVSFSGLAGGELPWYDAGSSKWRNTPAGSSGQVLLSAGAASPAWATLTAGDVNAVANVTHATGDLLTGDGTTDWTTLSPGTARRPLVSQGSGAAPSYATDVVPLTQRIEDGVTSAVSVCATITHDNPTGFNGADGIGARCLLRARNSVGAIADAAAIDGVLTTAAGSGEVGALDLYARAAGSLVQAARFTASGATVFTPTGINVSDASANTALTGLTINRGTVNTAAAGLAARIALRMPDAGGTLEDVAFIDGAWTNAGASTEASAVDVHTRTGGAAARRVVRFTAGGGMMLGAAVTQDPGVGGIAIPTTTGLYVESGATLYNLIGVFGAGVMTFGSGAFNCAITAFALTISSGGGTVISTGYLDLACGFRRRRTAVSDTNHTVTTAQSVIDITGLTAARTVTLPAFADGLIVTITNSDGSADGTKTVSVVASSGTNNINGVTTYVGINAAYGSVTLYCNSASSRWTVIAKV